MKKKTANSYETRISKEIRKVLIDALNQKDWYFFQNSQLCKCWEEMDCSNSRCPSYESSNLRCWQIAGTFCEGSPQGEFANKIGDCHKCRVFKKATEGNVILQIGEDFNNLMYHLKMKENELRSILLSSEEKNRELGELNDKIKKLVETLDKKNTLLRDLSIKDGLTGLYNYRFFREILYEQYNLAKRFKFHLSCVMLDIDYFKAVNDTYGHQVGDAILHQLSDILKQNVREADKVVRYGGEEFVMILPYTDHEAAHIKAERLRQVVSDHPFTVGDKKIGVTVSLGITSFPDNKKIKKAEHIVSYADKALYQAKQLGRNQTVVYAEALTKKRRGESGAGTLFTERRKHPRIQAVIQLKGDINSTEKFSGTTFDISYSGLCLLSSKLVESNRRMTVQLTFPDIEGKTKKAALLNLEGLAVWSKQIHEHGGKNHRFGMNYLMGIQFVNMSKKDRMYLQKYFVALFKMKS
jgi:diguanylate cyclase (GGDEF)-like protein